MCLGVRGLRGEGSTALGFAVGLAQQIMTNVQGFRSRCRV